ncbi:DNA mismatch repair protein-MLH3 family [Phaffia rhodozyma]|uniref:DNA mismatch repair protein-MLH3 family n=1 Tax=Phaffia rhodozyma TaxID=264483 RepID=A0A0F7SF24_PHARH|nr:DNA mismatch repair protein-MLH3 family [Phaffia rhodozyma]
MSDRHIKPLPSSLANHLRSQTIVPTLPQALSELIQNSLDAKSRHLSIYLSLSRWLLRVEDDGTGISRQGIERLRDGHRYMTSKSEPETRELGEGKYGYRGEALSSLAAVSRLEVVSRAVGSKDTWSFSIKGSQPIQFGPSGRSLLRSGTIVTIKDLFFNLPIRRTSTPSSASMLLACKKVVEMASLLFPHISFSLYDLEKEQIKEGGRMWSVSKTSTMISRFGQIHGVAMIRSVTPLQVSKQDIKIEGFISQNGAHSRAQQYIFVNNYALSWSDLHRAVEDRFEQSGFARSLQPELELGMFSPRSSNKMNIRKMERKAVYVLSITLPPNMIDVNMEPSKTVVQFEDESSIIALLLELVNSFLEKHGLCLQASRPSLLTDPVQSPPIYSKPSGIVPFKRSRGAEYESSVQKPNFSSRERSKSPSVRKRARSEVTDKRTVKEDSFVYKTGTWICEAPSINPAIECLNMLATSSKLVEIASPEQVANGPKISGAQGSRKECDHHEVVNCNSKQLPSWLSQVLKGWSNPTFASRNEAFVPQVELPILSRDQPLPSYPQQRRSLSNSNIFKSARLNKHDLPAHLSRESLCEASIISQVDEKFLACVLRSGSSTNPLSATREQKEMLVLIDQHAADERIRVERFLKELGEGFLAGSAGLDVDSSDSKGVALHRPLEPSFILLTRNEYLLLLTNPKFVQALSRWGIHLGLSHSPTKEVEGEGDEAFFQVNVLAVPKIVAGRLLGRKSLAEGPVELTELVKEFLAKSKVDGVDGWPDLDNFDPEFAIAAPTSENNDGDEDIGIAGQRWMKAMRFCPRVLLDLINSKACRGAIMFNDPLTTAQTTRLLHQLSTTLFPFQCAHGRPSMIPVVDLDIISEQTSSRSVQPPCRLDWERFGFDT